VWEGGGGRRGVGGVREGRRAVSRDVERAVREERRGSIGEMIRG